MDIQKVALVTNLSGDEEPAYRVAATLASRFGAILQLVHVVEQGGRCLRRAEEQLNETARSVDAFRGVQVQTVTLGGSDPYALLADFAGSERAQLVICARAAAGAGGLIRARILPERLAVVCAAPLLVLAGGGDLARRREETGPRRVLIPHALYEEPSTCADVRGLLFRERHRISFYPYRRPEAARAASGEDLVARPADSRPRDDAVHVLLGSGAPGEEIVKSARALGVDLIVASPGIDGACPGLSSEDLAWIVRHAPCSVLAVRAPVVQASTTEEALEGYELYCG